MVGWHHQLNGLKFEQALGDSEGQASLACCSPRDYKESDINEQLNSNSNNVNISISMLYFVVQSYKLLVTPWTAEMPGFSVLHHLLEFAQTPIL